MNLYRKNPLIVLSLFLLFGIRIQAQNAYSVEKDSILKEFKSCLVSQDSIDIHEFIKRYETTEIKTEETKYNGWDSMDRQIWIREDLIVQMDSIQKANNHLVSDKESHNSSRVWIRILKIAAWIAAIVAILVVLQLVKTRKKNKKVITDIPPTNNNNTDIVVRRKTTSILRKQSLEDVVDNDNYMKIDCEDFCTNSAVRRIYIKNTCIKDIYNMYAENLRNPNNPKEYGCMVLGRWVLDKETDEYYVSLEHVVLPGDDAVFTEYELNFGGKIKLKISQELRKLRVATELQYDVTCWVHSHPGLNVFFSNSDCTVQLQLKHPTHPRFLTAIVIDILTPGQELGIFTFKHDGDCNDGSSINSKADLKKMYSLEEWYKWAIESDRNSIKTEDHYNTLATAKAQIENCHGIELSNGAIIDMGMLAAEQHEGFIGTVHGFVNTKAGKTEYVATKVSSTETVPDNEPVGCFIMASHCSIPSLRKALADRFDKIGFVLVYTSGDGLLTSIPVINNDLCADQNFYGEQQLEELKIWTRRKR